MKSPKVFKSILCLLLVAIIASLPLSALAASKAYVLSVTVNNARLRTSSGASSSVIENLRKGTKLLYWGENSGKMCKVCTTGGKIGYVYRDYLSVYGAVKKNQVYVTNTSTKVYKRSGNSLRAFTKVSSGRYLLVIAQSGSWSYVRTITGSAGYVPTSAISKAF